MSITYSVICFSTSSPPPLALALSRSQVSIMSSVFEAPLNSLTLNYCLNLILTYTRAHSTHTHKKTNMRA